MKLFNDIKVSSVKDAKNEIEIRKEIYPDSIHKVKYNKDFILIKSIDIEEEIQQIKRKYVTTQL